MDDNVIEVNENLDWKSRVYGKKDTEYDVPDWKQIKKKILERDKFTCQRCGTKIKPLTVHHIIPRADGGSNSNNNLIALCNSCHDFVECNQLKNHADIVGSYESTTKTKELITRERIETFERPEWHRWVYGGERNPILDR